MDWWLRVVHDIRCTDWPVELRIACKGWPMAGLWGIPFKYCVSKCADAIRKYYRVDGTLRKRGSRRGEDFEA